MSSQGVAIALSGISCIFYISVALADVGVPEKGSDTDLRG